MLSWLDKGSRLAWVADVPSMCHHMGGRRPCCWLHSAPQACLSWSRFMGIRYGMRYVSALASPTFFSYRNIVGSGGFLGGPSCGLRMLFYWICSSHSTPTLLQLGLLFPLHPHSLPIPPPCLAVLRHIKHLRHQHITSAWFSSSPLHLPIPLPIPHHQSGMLHSHQVLKASAQYFGWFASSPLPCHLVHSLTSPTGSSAIHG